MKYTICGTHYQDEHQGDWKKCKKCKTDREKALYDDHATNKFNFETKSVVKKDKILCCNCGFASFDLSDFVGCVPNDEINYYFCLKPACKRRSGFQDTNDGEDRAFLFQFRHFWPKENDQRNLAIARSVNNCATSLPPSIPETVDEVDELSKQATKMLKKVVFSFFLSRAITRLKKKNLIYIFKSNFNKKKFGIYLKRLEIGRRIRGKDDSRKNR